MNASILQRLLSYPHPAVFEKDSASELVFRLRHPDGAAWSIADGVMLARAGALERSYDLPGMTVAGLIGALRADGFEVLHINARFDTYSALVLTEGSGDQGGSNGDHVMAFTSLMWMLFTGYAREIGAAEYQIRQALLQMVIKTAEGEWLDLWGALYSVQRLPGETDAAYRIRIPREAFRIRVNALAIELAILELTGKDVRILEPWVEVFTLDHSALDSDHKLQDESRTGYFFIQPLSRTPIDWSDVLPIIERNRPAGVLMLPPQVRNSIGIDAGLNPVVGTAIRRRHTASVRVEDLALLDYALIEDTSTLNHQLLHRRTIRHRGGAKMGSVAWTPHKWTGLPWGDVTYLVSTKYVRSYRLYKLSATYASQPWRNEVWRSDAWSSISAIIGTAHSRTS